MWFWINNSIHYTYTINEKNTPNILTIKIRMLFVWVVHSMLKKHFFFCVKHHFFSFCFERNHLHAFYAHISCLALVRIRQLCYCSLWNAMWKIARKSNKIPLFIIIVCIFQFTVKVKRQKDLYNKANLLLCVVCV